MMKRLISAVMITVMLAMCCGTASAGLLDGIGGLIGSVVGGDSDDAFRSDDLKTKLDAVEAFYDDYCKFMKKLAKHPDDPTLLADYAVMAARAVEAELALASIDEDKLSEKDLAYFLKVEARIAKKLAALGMSLG